MSPVAKAVAKAVASSLPRTREQGARLRHARERVGAKSVLTKYRALATLFLSVAPAVFDSGTRHPIVARSFPAMTVVSRGDMLTRSSSPTAARADRTPRAAKVEEAEAAGAASVQEATSVDGEEIQRLVEERIRFRAARDFASADALKAQLNELGVVVNDQEGTWRYGTTWTIRKIKRANTAVEVPAKAPNKASAIQKGSSKGQKVGLVEKAAQADSIEPILEEVQKRYVKFDFTKQWPPPLEGIQKKDALSCAGATAAFHKLAQITKQQSNRGAKEAMMKDQRFQMLIDAIAERHTLQDARDVAMIWWAMGTMEYLPLELGAPMMRGVIKQVKEANFEGRHVANVVWSFGRLLRTSELMANVPAALLERLEVEAIDLVESMNGINFVQLLEGFEAFDYRPTLLRSKIATALNSNSELVEELRIPEISMLCNAFAASADGSARGRVYDEVLLKLFKKSATLLTENTYNPRKVITILRACLRARFEFRGVKASLIQQWVEAIYKANRQRPFSWDTLALLRESMEALGIDSTWTQTFAPEALLAQLQEKTDDQLRAQAQDAGADEEQLDAVLEMSDTKFGYIELIAPQQVKMVMRRESENLVRGARVQIEGWQSRADLDGNEGICRKWLDDEGRWAVRLDDGEEILIQSQYLNRVEAERAEESFYKSLESKLWTLPNERWTEWELEQRELRKNAKYLSDIVSGAFASK
jgi:hypothetical protein